MLPELKIGNLVARYPIIQGGMGVGISLSSLAGAVAKAGGIGIISAMLHHPQLLILDEPFNFLDPSSQSVIKHLLKRYNEEHGATVIISSHNLNHTVDVCPRIALLEYGIIIRDIINEDNSAEKELEAYFNVEE